MFAQGLVAEVRDLLSGGLREGRTASQALGYRQVIAALDAGTDPAAAAEPIAAATRRFVRRQRSWFRRDPRIRWLDCQQPDLLERALVHTRNG
jgi:tRNA dimethylallyltransferase